MLSQFCKVILGAYGHFNENPGVHKLAKSFLGSNKHFQFLFLFF